MSVDAPKVAPSTEPPAVLRLGWAFVRTTTGFGWKLLQRQTPLALAGPLGRAPAVRSTATLRSNGSDVEVTGDLAATYPHATGRIVVLVPDSEVDETSWNAGHEEYGGTYPSRLAALLDWTPVHLRAAPPRASSEVAADLSGLLQMLIDRWPVPVERVALIGAGDGGLALRAAAGVPALGERTWQRFVSHVVVLGTPHLVVEPARGSIGLGKGLDEELAGIVTTDLAAVDLAPIEHAAYAVITRPARLERNPLGALLGNLVWWRDRSRFRQRQAHHLFPSAEVVHVDDARAPLVNHPEVQRALLDWLV